MKTGFNQVSTGAAGRALKQNRFGGRQRFGCLSSKLEVFAKKMLGIYIYIYIYIIYRFLFLQISLLGILLLVCWRFTFLGIEAVTF